MNLLQLCQQQEKAEKRGVWFAQRWRSRAGEADTSTLAAPASAVKDVRVFLSASVRWELSAPSVAFFFFFHFIR